MLNCKNDKNRLLVSFAAVIALSGCASTGEQYQANVYKAGQVNTTQSAKTIEIVLVQPAKIEVDNSKGKKQAQMVGGLLGAIAGGVGGNLASRNRSLDRSLGTAGGAIGGGAIGTAAGSLAADKVLVSGVSLTYVDTAGQTLNSAQVGKLCEFTKGTALMISTTQNETRIQPNNTGGCKG